MRSGRCGSLSRWALGCLLAWAGCTSSERTATPPEDTWEDVCVDPDGDGHGFQCQAGEDCDESDPNVFVGCQACSKPGQGCACEPNAAPVDCELPKELTASGSLLCRTGTRYCRDGVWSECEGIKSFETPPPSRFLANKIIDTDAGLVTCGECRPDCYQVTDPLGSDAGSEAGISLGPNVVTGTNGGITLSTYVVGDGGTYDSGLLDDPGCIHGTWPDYDCDGVPDDFDQDPGAPPFESDHDVIFMDLAPGDQQSETFEINFFLNTADIYFYLDMTGSMADELTNLIDSLRNGNFMTDGGAGVECADRNFNGDTSDEEYLKDEGIAGNIACLIRDSWLGAGWHRDLPFPRPDTTGFAYGPHDFEAFGHEQNLTNDVDLVLTALNRFHTRGGINRPEGGIMGLYALATGTELYMGWDRPGNPAPSCGAATWGYPCFREDAVPIVIWMTDAPVVNGPEPEQGHLGVANTLFCNNCVDSAPFDNNVDQVDYFTKNQPVYWDPVSLDIEMGSDDHYNRVGNSHETFATALDLGAINDSFRTYAGTTSGMTANVTYATAGFCSANNATTAWLSTEQGAPDAVFKFTVTEEEPITISTRGSRFQSTLAIIDADRIDVGGGIQTTTSVSAPSVATAHSLGTLGSSFLDANISGTTTSSGASFTRDALGTCLTNTGANDKVGASVLRFNLANDLPQLRVVSNPNFNVATALFAGAPGVPTDTALSSISVSYGTGTRSNNSNDYFGNYPIGDMVGQYRRFTSGSTTDSDLAIANFPASYFQTATLQAGGTACTGVSGTTPDAVFDFSLSAPTTLRIEGTNNNSTLAATFDHVIGLVRRTTTRHLNLTGINTDSAAHVMLESDMPDDATVWSQYTGLLTGSTTQYVQTEVGTFSSPSICDSGAAAANGGYQAVFALDVTQTQSYDFNTAGSGVTPTWISIHEDVADTQRANIALGSSNPNNGHTNLTTGTRDLGVMDEVSVFVTGGNVNASPNHGTAAADFVNLNTMGSTCGSGNGGRDGVFRFTVAQTQTISIDVGNAAGTPLSLGSPGFNTYLTLYRGALTDAARVAGGCTDQGGTTSTASQLSNITVTPGATYYIVVKSVSTSNPADPTYTLWVRDTSFSSHFRGCDTGSGVNSAQITRTLAAGHRYYIIVKGATSNAFTLNARRTPVTDVPMLACDRSSGGGQHSVIETSLPAGNYSVIIRGYATGNQGSYNLIMRDLGAAPLPLACQYDANAATPPALTVNNLAARDGSGTPIDYYLVMRGNTSVGNYTMRVDDASLNTTQCAPYNNVTMTTTITRPPEFTSVESPATYTDSDTINNGEWTGTLPVGDYYVVLKGYNQSDSATNTEDDDSGMYQLTVGDQTNFERFGKFADKRWLGADGTGPGGVLEALNQRKIRVITVDSTDGSGDDDTYSDQQLETIARATDAVATGGAPLFFKINDDGTGLGSAVVDAVNLLAKNLAIDVGVRLVKLPDTPPRDFNFLVRAIDMPGDLCEPPVDRDHDPAGTPDTHVRCKPGAVPRFEVTFSNPAEPNNVPTNDADLNGGWNMTLELFGDGFVDPIPVYIIPEDVVENPGDDRFHSSGSYEQPVSANGCMGNEAPLWSELVWDADIPSGASLVWSLCTADTLDELPNCTPRTIATVTQGAACDDNGDCPGGYCHELPGPGRCATVTQGAACDDNGDCPGGYCHELPGPGRCEYATGPACSADADCGTRGRCVSGTCNWTDNPISVKPALGPGQQGNQHARVLVTLNANTARTEAPTINHWTLKYSCAAQE